MSKCIRFISFYDIEENKAEKRYTAPAAVNKMNSIIDGLIQNGHNVEIISMSSTKGKTNCCSHVFHINNNLSLKLFYSFGRKNHLYRLLEFFFIRLQMFYYLLKRTKKNDTILVYHSLEYARLVKLAKKIKKFFMILEMEEIYGDVNGCAKDKKVELSLSNKADGYIFPTVLLDELVNKEKKPSVIIHGTYRIEETKKSLFKDNKIHVIYAGTLDLRKGGAKTAVASSINLNGNYHVHIVGFGSEEDKKSLLSDIAEVSQKTNCLITYDGLKSGDEYIQFIQSCHIGLSTQNPSGAFNETSFPSKVLSYLANGLRVVSIKIRALETSAVNDLLYYYEEDKPEEVAKAILSIDLKEEYDSRKRIGELYTMFVKNLQGLIEDVSK